MTQVRLPRGDRPWRRVGLVICIVLAVMFLVGDYVFDVATAVQRPIAFTMYWLVMMGLVGWLCFLAVRDVAYTRRMISVWKAERDSSNDLEASRRDTNPTDRDDESP
jgi:hypothetical protein